MNRILLPALLLLAGPAVAQPVPTAPAAESRDAKLDRAHRLHEQANAIRDEAERRHADADAACRQKFFVNSCLDDAHQAQMEQTLKARALDKEARELERDVKRQDVADREAQRAREAPEKAAAAAAQAEKNRKAVEEAEREVAHKQAEAAAREAGKQKP